MLTVYKSVRRTKRYEANISPKRVDVQTELSYIHFSLQLESSGLTGRLAFERGKRRQFSVGIFQLHYTGWIRVRKASLRYRLVNSNDRSILFKFCCIQGGLPYFPFTCLIFRPNYRPTIGSKPAMNRRRCTESNCSWELRSSEIKPSARPLAFRLKSSNVKPK